MSKVNILHLSDLPYDSSHHKDIEIILDALWKDLLKLKEEDLMPDFVVFSGDIVNKGDNKEDYDKVQEVFINPLLETLGLEKDYLFVAPGNHDIQKSKIREYEEHGLTHTLTNRTKVNSLLDSIDEDEDLPIFDRLSNFNEFREKIDSNHKINSNVLYTTYRFKIDGLIVGITCLNSSWRASGGSDNVDHGKLLIGERQVDNSATDVKDSDLKIGVIPFGLPDAPILW